MKNKLFILAALAAVVVSGCGTPSEVAKEGEAPAAAKELTPPNTVGGANDGAMKPIETAP